MPRSFLLILLWLVSVVAFALPANAAAPLGKRVALVIGNSDYQNAVRLPNPERDAKAVAEKLRKLGFVVVEGYDLNHDGFEDAIKDFSIAVRGADIGMFFYAGHGMQVNGRNYLVPIDAAFQDISALDFEAISMDLVTKQMQQDVAVRLVVLDACRDNPLSKTLSRSLAGTTRSAAIAEGLAEVKLGDAGEGTAIIFATSPDEVALDGEGEHSPFTTALLHNIDLPDTDLPVVMSRITGEVYNSTNQQQRPWINASLTGEVILNPQSRPAATETTADKPKDVPADSTDTLARETALYNLARDSGLREDYLAYLEVFPDGLYAVNARKQLERLDQEAKDKEEKKGVASAVITPPEEPVARSVTTEVIDLPVTDTVRAMESSELTEADLEFDREKRTEIQVRLTLAGFDTGGHDGAFGRKTRNALGSWQTSRGLTPTGYLNQPQYELLMAQTELKYASYEPGNPDLAPAGGTTKKTHSSGRRSYSGRARGDAEQVGRIIGGVVRGALRRF
jgi:peptidoglycan hydrolase-like protein with peptidoglycan-binding domain